MIARSTSICATFSLSAWSLMPMCGGRPALIRRMTIMAERKLESQLERLSAMALPELRSEWRRVYRKPAPNPGADLVASGIAWRLQDEQYAGLPPALARKLAKPEKTR